MTYVLCAYGFVLFAAVYGFIWTLGGPRAKLILSLGAYAPRSARRPARLPRSHRGHPNHRDRRVELADFADLLHAGEPRHAQGERPWWQDDRHTPGIDAAPTVTIPATHVPIMIQAGTPLADLVAPRPHMVRADIDQPGAEHWGDLLRDMNTEERTVYSPLLVVAYEETKEIERPFLAELDAAVDRFNAALERLDRRTEAAFVGVGANLLRGHGGPDRWSTGQFPIVERATS